MEWKRRKLDPFIDVTSIFRIQSLNSSLSLVFELNYKLQNRVTTSILSNKEPKILKTKRKTKSKFRSLFLYKTLLFISKTPEGKEWGDKRSKLSPYLHQQAADPRPGCGQVATSWWRIGWRELWLPFVLVDSLFQLMDLKKWSLIVGFNHLIWEDPFQPVFNLSDLPRSALIS